MFIVYFNALQVIVFARCRQIFAEPLLPSAWQPGNTLSFEPVEEEWRLLDGRAIELYHFIYGHPTNILSDDFLNSFKGHREAKWVVTN